MSCFARTYCTSVGLVGNLDVVLLPESDGATVTGIGVAGDAVGAAASFGEDVAGDGAVVMFCAGAGVAVTTMMMGVGDCCAAQPLPRIRKISARKNLDMLFLIKICLFANQDAARAFLVPRLNCSSLKNCGGFFADGECGRFGMGGVRARAPFDRCKI